MVLLEWPDRAAGFLPPDRLDVAFTLAPQAGPEPRKARITGYGAFATRAERIPADPPLPRHQRLRAGANDGALQGDASTRSYERLQLGEQRAILMNSPRRPDGPPVRGGKPYSAIAHLAEDVMPFVAMANGAAPARLLGAADLRGRPRRRPADPRGSRHRARGDRRSAGADRGALCGRGRRTGRAAQPGAAERHAGRAARRPFAAALRSRRLPDRSRAAARLVSAAARHRGDGRGPRRLRRAVARALQVALEAPPTWVLRDFHSPNLLWLPERDGHRPRRPARLPGRHDGPGRLRSRLAACRMPASTCRS